MTTTNSNRGRWIGRYPILIGALIIGIVLLMLLAGIDAQIRHHTYQIYLQSFQNQVDESASRLRHEILVTRSQIRFLQRLPPIRGILRATDNGGYDAQDDTRLDQWKKRLTTIFVAFIETNPHVRQVRYIGAANKGLELVRVERKQGKIIVTPEDQMQTKGKTKYFKATAQQPADHVYLSNIELNREHGVIEKPQWPTLRAAMPVYHDNKQLFGIVIVNYDATYLLKIATGGTSNGNRYLVNQRGNYLVNPDPAIDFAFETGGTRNWKRDFGEDHPTPTSENWHTVLAADDDWHYTAAAVNLGSPEQPRHIYIVNAINDEQIEPAVHTKLTLVLIFVGVLFTGLIFLGWIISKAVAQE